MQPIIDMISKALNTVGVKVDTSLLEGLNFPNLMGKITDPKAFQNEIATQLMSKVGINSDMASKVGSMMDVSKLGDLGNMAGMSGDMGKMATGAVAAVGAGGIFGAVTDMVSNLFGGHHDEAQKVEEGVQELSQEVNQTIEQAPEEMVAEQMVDPMDDMMQADQDIVIPEVTEVSDDIQVLESQEVAVENAEVPVEEVITEETETGEKIV